LSDALEKHPAIFTDVAHRKPSLVTRLFVENPDLLMVSSRWPEICTLSTCFIFD